MASSSSSSFSRAIFLLGLLLLATVSTDACSTCPSPKPKPCPSPTPATCPKDTLKLGVCVDLLGLVNIVVGSPPTTPCCTLLEGLADLEAALCLCTVIKANLLGINLEVPVALSLLLSACQKTVPPGFQCA